MNVSPTVHLVAERRALAAPENGLDHSTGFLGSAGGGSKIAIGAPLDGPQEWVIRAPHLVDGGQIHMRGRVGPDRPLCAERVRASLGVLREFDPIRVIIDSDGGNSNEGWAIYSVLRECGKRVEVDIVKAMSSAAVIAMAGDRIRIAHDGNFLIHHPRYHPNWIERGFDGLVTAQSLRALADRLEADSDREIDIWHRRTGLSRDHLRSIMDQDEGLLPARVVELGFADVIIDERPNLKVVPIA